jgi:hypothetical protein
VPIAQNQPIGRRNRLLKVFVHVDADPTSLHAPSAHARADRSNSQMDEMNWTSLSLTFNFLKAFGEKTEKQGLIFKSTFFLRADDQIKSIYNEHSHVFLKFHDDISEIFCTGWHPHLLRWSGHTGNWQQEYRDYQWISQSLANTYEDLQSQGFNVLFSKMGWCFHSNTSMKTLSELGIEADFSALPGAKAPGRLIDGRSLQDRYDWSRTKPLPYHPDERDYQSAGDLRILEIPLTTYELSGIGEFLYTLKLALSSYRRLDFSYSPSFRRTAPLILPDLARIQDLKSFCEKLILRNRDYIAIYLHPNELLDAPAKTVFENFVFQLASIAEDRRLELSFADARDLFNLYA